MRNALALVVFSCIGVLGCGAPVAETATGANSGGPDDSGRASATSRSDRPSTDSDSASRPAMSESGELALTPDNTRIQFVGTHVGDRPDPRTGTFGLFSGTIGVDPATMTLESISIDIETDTLSTEIARLTTHLKSPDFFEVRQYPRATFQSKQIEPGSEGQFQVVGDLSLHGVTKEIRFPAIVENGEEGMKLTSDFTINRSDFGMVWGPERVEEEVVITVAVGEMNSPGTQSTTQNASGTDAPGGGPGPRVGLGRGNFDPAQIFEQRDADGDGKLTGDEISDRMRQNLEAMDTDGDGAVSLEEFQARMQQFRGRRGGGPGQDREESGSESDPQTESP